MRRTAIVIVGLGVLPVLAQAECGWLLIMPPHWAAQQGADHPDKPFPTVPIAQWVHDESFDTAQACQDKVKRLRQALPDRMAYHHMMWLYARCLPASQVPIR